MSTERVTFLPPQTPVSLGALTAAHHGQVRAGLGRCPASRLLAAELAHGFAVDLSDVVGKSENFENFFGGNFEWGTHNSPQTNPIEFQNSNPGSSEAGGERP